MRSRSGTAWVTVAATATAAAAVAQHVIGKATCDALFLASFGAASLPIVMIASATASLVALLSMGRLLARYGPARVVPLTFGASAALAMIELFVLSRAPAVTALLVYLHLAVFGATSISAFWSLVSERFDPHAAKRKIARVASGGTIGGVIGAVVTFAAAAPLGAHGTLAMMAGCHAFAAGVSLVVRDGVPMTTASSRDAPSGLAVLRRVRYLRDLAILVLILAAIDALLDWVLGVTASHTYGDREQLLSFFALFQLGIGVLTLFAQVLLATRVIERLGVGGAMLGQPISVVVIGVFALAAPRLFGAALLRGTSATFGNSFHRSGAELLFSPVPPGWKRPSKTLIDVGFDRLGAVLGGALAGLIAATLPSLGPSVVMRAAILLAVVAALFAARLRTGYVVALEHGLRAAAERLPVADAIPPALNREQLLHEIEVLRRDRLLAPDGPISDRTSGTPLPTDEASARTLLAIERLDHRVVPWAVDLLGDDTLHGAAIASLRRVVDEHAGGLTDALLARDTHFDVRRRIPRVLARATTQRALDGLVEALSDPRFEVRREVGLALLHLTSAHPHLLIPRERVLDAVDREVDVERGVWSMEPPLTAHEPNEQEELAPFLDRVVRDRTERSIEHVFALLALVYGREPTMLALRALRHGDRAMRGTALEYLENVLPRGLRERLWPFLGDDTARPRTSRSRRELLEALLRSGPILVPHPLKPDDPNAS